MDNDIDQRLIDYSSEYRDYRNTKNTEVPLFSDQAEVQFTKWDTDKPILL